MGPHRSALMTVGISDPQLQLADLDRLETRIDE